ncbi:MAG: phosphoribosylformylglycinamidine synthase I [Candidatus Omnitrophota bacterium]
MKKIKTLILRTAGTNCDVETAYAFVKAGAEAELVHINVLKDKKGALDKYHILAIPGGFTYGDDIASGKILANEMKSHLGKELLKFVSRGKLVIGICNGFQVLVKMGLLPAVNMKDGFKMEATLSLNDSGCFIDKWVYLKKNETRCVWTCAMPDVINLPIAHAEGKFMPCDGKLLDSLKKNGQIVFRYTDDTGTLFGSPHTPNGSVYDIAGICDPSGRILGMMPHPERHITYLQHPNWRRMSDKKDMLGVGLGIFREGVKFARNNL